MNIDALITDNSGGNGGVSAGTPMPPNAIVMPYPVPGGEAQAEMTNVPPKGAVYPMGKNKAAGGAPSGNIDIDKLIRDNSTPEGAVSGPAPTTPTTSEAASTPKQPLAGASFDDNSWLGQLDKFTSGLTQSLVGGMIPGSQYAGPAMTAAMQAPFSGEDYSQAYNRLRGEYQQQQGTFQQNYPITAGASSILGALATPGIAQLPFASGSAPLVSRVLQNAATNAGVGGVTGALNTPGDFTDRMRGAGEGAIGGAVIGGGLTALGGVLRGAAPLVPGRIGRLARETGAANELNRVTAGQPIEQPVLPGVQYNLGQAVGTPGATTASRWANAQAVGETGATGKAVAANQATANNQAVLRAIQNTAPNATAHTAGVASTAHADAMREADTLLSQHEDILYSHGPMAIERLTTQRFANSMKAHGANMSSAMRAVGMTSPLRRLMNEIQALPSQHRTLTAHDMNTYKSAFLSMARNPPSTNPQAAGVARYMAGAARKAMRDVVNREGSPSLRTAYQNAINFTHEKAALFSQPDTHAVARGTNSAGAWSVKASQAAQRLFNLSKGAPENPENVQNIRYALRGLRLQWTALQRAGHPVDPADLTRVEQQLRTSTQDWLVSRLLDTTTAKLDEQGNRFLNTDKLADLLNDNAGWMVGSGIIDRNALRVYADVLHTISRLRRTDTGGAANVSDNWGKRVTDAIISPSIKTVGRLGAWGVAAWSAMHGHVGEAIGEVAAGHVGGQFIGHFVEGRREAMRELLTHVAQDPDFARQMQQRASTRLNNQAQQRVLRMLMYLGGRGAGATH